MISEFFLWINWRWDRDTQFGCQNEEMLFLKFIILMTIKLFFLFLLNINIYANSFILIESIKVLYEFLHNW